MSRGIRGMQALRILGRPLYDYCSPTRGCMRKIQLRDAKASLSAVIDAAVQGKPAVITRHGKPEAVILSFQEYKRLSEVPSFGRLLMSLPAGTKRYIKRDRSPIRDVDL